jgi:hypothetical protein
MNHLVAGNFDDLVAALHRGADEHVTAATPTA